MLFLKASISSADFFLVFLLYRATLQERYSMPQTLLYSWMFRSDRTQRKFAEMYFWKSLWTDVELLVRTCTLCQTTNNAMFALSSNCSYSSSSGAFTKMPVMLDMVETTFSEMLGPEGNSEIICLEINTCGRFFLHANGMPIWLLPGRAP